MLDQINWLREQIAETKKAALAARAEWGDEDDHRDADWEKWRPSGKLEDAGWYPPPTGLDRHWQLHSPRAVLAQCEAHTAILDSYDAEMEDGDYLTLCGLGAAVDALTLAYRHRPGYRPEWRP
jgi:hypothetical protein